MHCGEETGGSPKGGTRCMCMTDSFCCTETNTML